ncbi:MAG: alpha/beta fold hydrolase [Nocardioidaceae bacterium]
MANASLGKSTIVRIKIRGLRAGFRIAEALAPAVGARAAVSLWFRTPPPVRSTPLPTGGVSFEVTSMGGAVRGTYWGAGPVVYFLHGWGGRGDQFAGFVEPLLSTGHRVVLFDAPSHGVSDPGPSGRGRAHGVEFGRALDDVAAKFGPARAIVAHSMGAVPALLSLRDGWVGADRLVFISPMGRLSTSFDEFGAMIGFGPRIRRAMDVETERLTGYPVSEFSVRTIAAGLTPMPPALVVHDRTDRVTSHDESADAVQLWPDATFVSTDGLGHGRILRDAGVIGKAVRHVTAAASDADDELEAIA